MTDLSWWTLPVSSTVSLLTRAGLGVSAVMLASSCSSLLHWSFWPFLQKFNNIESLCSQAAYLASFLILSLGNLVDYWILLTKTTYLTIICTSHPCKTESSWLFNSDKIHILYLNTDYKLDIWNHSQENLIFWNGTVY